MFESVGRIAERAGIGVACLGGAVAIGGCGIFLAEVTDYALGYEDCGEYGYMSTERAVCRDRQTEESTQPLKWVIVGVDGAAVMVAGGGVSFVGKKLQGTE